jgi:hypothetical protein
MAVASMGIANVISGVLGSGGGGGSTSSDSPYGADLISNILGPFTPQYWMSANAAKKQQKKKNALMKAQTEQLKTQTLSFKDQEERQKRIRSLLYWGE